MIREEILAMKPGRGLDALVAERLFKIHTATKIFSCSHGRTFEHKATFPNYSTDISAAWEVVEKMRRPFSTRQKFSQAMQYLMNQELIESDAEIRIAPHEIIWHMTPLNISKAALLACMEVE